MKGHQSIVIMEGVLQVVPSIQGVYIQMSNGTGSNFAQAIHRANQHRPAAWRWWRYTSDDEVLVLCGYRPIFEKIGYLVFRRPWWVCLPWALVDAEFALDEAAVGERNHTLFLHDNFSHLHRVSIYSQGREYGVICEAVSFYPLSTDEEGNTE